MGLQRDIFMGFKVNGAVNLHVFREWAAPVGERFQKLLTFSKYVRRVRCLWSANSYRNPCLSV